MGEASGCGRGGGDKLWIILWLLGKGVGGDWPQLSLVKRHELLDAFKFCG